MIHKYPVSTRLPGIERMAHRMDLAEERFIENVMERGYSKTDATQIFEHYKKLRVIKLDAVNGVWAVRHGALWDGDILKKALEQSKAANPRRR